MEARTCKTCRYFEQAAKGHCHRNPPVMDSGFTTFPVVSPESWCGEWVMFKGKAK